MTSPGETTKGDVERVPLKVVPIFVQPLEDEPDVEEEIVAEEPAPKRLRPYLGIVALLLALATVGVHIAAIVVASSGDFPTGTYLGYGAIGVSALAVVFGLVAAVSGSGRAWGIIAAVLAVLANPWVLLIVLRFLSGAQTA